MTYHCGDMVAIWFDENGASIRGFELHCPLGHPDRRPDHARLFDGLPDSLSAGARGAYAHGGDALTFVLWCGADDGWQTGRLTFDADENGDVDGSETGLWMLVDDRTTFLRHATDRWNIGGEAARHATALFEMQPISVAAARAINPDVDVDAVMTLAGEIGWPIREGNTARDGMPPRRS